MTSTLRQRIRCVCRGKAYPLALVAVLCLAGALRLWNYSYGLNRGGDARKKIKASVAVMDGVYVPDNYKQPHFLIHSFAAVLRGLPDRVARDNTLRENVAGLYMIALSLLTLVVAFTMAGRLFAGRAVPLLAALLLAVAPINVIGSRYFKEDIPLMLWTNVALLCMVLLITRKRPVYYLLSGLATGVAISAKYTAVEFVPFLILAHILVVAQAEAGGRLKAALEPRFFIGLGLIVVGFLLFNPCLLLAFNRFAQHIAKQTSYVGQGHHDGTCITGSSYHWTFYLHYGLVPGLTQPLTIASLAGLAAGIAGRRKAAVFVAAWCITKYLTLESSPAKPFPFFARYLHPMVPALCIFAAYGLCRAWAAARRPGLRATVFVAGACCVAMPLTKTGLINHSLANDTFTAAANWVRATLPPGAQIHTDSYAFHGEIKDFDRHAIRRDRVWAGLQPQDFVDREDAYFVVLSSEYERFRYSRRYSPEAERSYYFYKHLFRNYPLIKEFKPRFRCQTYATYNPVVRVYHLHPNGDRADRSPDE